MIPIVPKPSASTAFAVIPAVVLAAAALTVAPAAAQDERMVGIWQKDLERSDADWPHRHDRRLPNAADIEVEVSLDGEDVVMVFTSRRGDWPTPQTTTAHYITDNKPNPVPDIDNGTPREVRAKWRKRKLSVSYTIRFPFEADIEQSWEVSKDGQNLVLTRFGRVATQPRPDIRKNYFVRATAVQ
ncbi:MAG: hypothetical protein OYL92_02350 [Acidobacteriota bacterium]|nr:hypothetical protein [Acidobacteriota bacterium]MDE3263784.1 hypothetical protein [Acidobacteriota bacterium]